MRNVTLILTAVLLLGFGRKAEAQQPCFAKMSPLVREACLLSEGSRVAGAKSYGLTGHEQGVATRGQSITALVKTDDDCRCLAEADCDVLAHYGGLAVVSIPVGSLASLSRQKSVLRIEAGRMAHTTMDTTTLIVGATALHTAIALPRSYTGKGVVVGVQDIGFDLTHPNFWSADMSRYRVKALWDQLATDTTGSRLPVGRDYRDSLALLSLGRPRDGDTQTHGTHTAGIAAGSGSEGVPFSLSESGTQGHYTGIAPDADLCLVCNATTDDIDLIDSADYYKYTYALDALGFKYMFDYAKSVGKPCVVNFSEGSEQDFHGDDLLYYEMLDSLTGPGRIIVASAGNEGMKTAYLRKPAATDTAETGVTGQPGARTMSFTTRSTADFVLRVIFGGDTIRDYSLHDIVAAPDSLLTDSLNVGDRGYTIVAAAYPDCYGGGRTAADWVISATDAIYPDTFKVQVIGYDADVELYAGSASFSNLDGNDDKSPSFSAIVADNSHSVLSPGSAPAVICVGMSGYRTSFRNYLGNTMNFGGSRDGAINPNSSIGPTRDGRTKPDVVAPGQHIVSSYSSYYLANNPDAGDINSDVRHFQYDGRTYAWNSNLGTSMSAPVVAGVIALWLEADPTLTPADCMDIIAKTSTHYDPTLSYPNNTYGYGQIDALAGMRLVLERATGIKSVRPTPAGDGEIYTIDGRRAGSDARRLPKGLYIINNKVVAL